jgi:hypothetical protein
MYTSQPCGLPSGATPVPTALLTAAQNAAQSTIQNGGSLSDAMGAVNAAIQNFLNSNQLPTSTIGTPTSNVTNATMFAQSAGAVAAKQALTDRQMRLAQWTFNRLMVRRASDYAGTAIAPGQFNTSQNGNAKVFAQKRYCVLPPQPPVVQPVTAAFSYTPAPIPLTTTPLVVPPPIPAPPAPTPAQVRDCRTGNLCKDIQSGCVLTSSVSPAQLLACAQSPGNVGNYNLYPAIAAQGGMPATGLGAVRLMRRTPARPMRRVA